jgi:uncharacterized LabA/DUF88 family protein
LSKITIQKNDQKSSACKNIAYIDGSNLYMGIKELGGELDYVQLYRWLLDKYRIQKAYIFMGYIAEQKNLYKYLEKAGFELIFKETVFHKGTVKGNADAELILHSVRDFYEKDINEVLLISGDGDFSCLIDFLCEKKIFKTLVIPNSKFCSCLLRKKNIQMVFLDDARLFPKITKKRKSP